MTTKIQSFLRAASSLIGAVAIAGAMAFAAAPATAQQTEISPEHLALAREYIELTDKDGIYQLTLLQTGLDTFRTLVQQNPEVEEQIDMAIAQAIRDYAPRAGDLLDQIARVYAAQFSVEELQQIVAFYKTDVGVKLATQSGLINNELGNVVEVFSDNLNTEFFARVRATLREQGIEI